MNFDWLLRHALTGIVLSLACLVGDPCLSQDDIETGREAFAQRSYPWYDAETDGIKRIEMKQRMEAKSKTRNKIPLAPPAKPRRITNWGGLDTSGLGYVAWVLIGVLVVGLAVALVWAFLRMGPNQDPDDEALPRRSMAESINELPFQLESSTGDFRQLAQQAMTAGDYRLAMIYLFSHVLVSLDQSELIRLRKGKTNRQYLNELRPHLSLANYYQGVMVPFEAVFFGEHEPDVEAFNHCWSQLDRFLTGVSQAKHVHHA